MTEAIAIFGNTVAREVQEVSTDPACLDSSGWWVVTQTFEGRFTAYRFGDVRVGREHIADITPPTTAQNIPRSQWVSSMSQFEYTRAVETIRSDIERGWVYQTNLCRVLTAQSATSINPLSLWLELQSANPAPHGGLLHVPELDVMVVSASPELFLSRNANELVSSPIKGTARQESDLLEKDNAENIMIVDLVRNDLSRVCTPGSVNVQDLLRLEHHPGLVHLVSDVVGSVSHNTTWKEILEALTPPGSVSGAPKSSALEVIARLEPTPRDIYCGAFGWVNANNDTASLAVAIRTFWQTKSSDGYSLHFGTGAGITWGSDPLGEWQETELKAQRLLSIAQSHRG